MQLHPKSVRHLALIGGAAACLLAASPAAAQTGGSATPGGMEPPPPTVPGSRAVLKPNGKAVAPAGAPQAVVDAIAAGNRIRKKPYIYGGGHKSFKAKGYDCSGAVSYVLNGAGLLSSPLPSGPLMKWGAPGKGKWITVYANSGHTYAMVAGLRWDTSGGPGPRWHKDMRSSGGFAKRNYKGL